jgi:hypothetical protein
VPDEDGALLALPPLSRADALLEDSARRLKPVDFPLLDRSYREVRALARREALAAARHYLADAGEPFPEASSGPILMGGHQPELFHPGVWVKNFALHGLARNRGVGLNLVVDNDALKSAGLKVPDVTLPLPGALESRTRVETIPLDAVPPGLPYEEWRVRDEGRFVAVPDRLPRNWPFEPMLPAFWAEVRRQAERTPLAGERFASARRVFERRWGCHNLELPVSVLCQTTAFAVFATSLLLDLPPFVETCNARLRDYRRQHGLKSPQHPFPDLARDGDWYEAPFWTWRPGQTQRVRLFARRRGDALDLRLGKQSGPTLPTSEVVNAFRALESEGIKVRCRALTLTLFCRLFVADLFLHGIGGGKYDAVTDAVMRDYYRIDPPPLLIVSGTLRLPLPTYPSTPADLRRRRLRLRDLKFNPQRHLTPDGDTHALLTRRAEQVSQSPADAVGRRQRWRELRQINELLSPALADKRHQTEAELQRATAEVRANALLRRRDWAFCLYPEPPLRAFCTQALDSEGREPGQPD